MPDYSYSPRFYASRSLRVGEGGVHIALRRSIADSCELRCIFHSGWFPSDLLMHFGLTGFSSVCRESLGCFEVQAAKGLVDQISLSCSKTGIMTGRQALIIPSEVSREVRSAIRAYRLAMFVDVMPVVTLIRTSVTIHMLCRMSALGKGGRHERDDTYAMARENMPLIAIFRPVGI